MSGRRIHKFCRSFRRTDSRVLRGIGGAVSVSILLLPLPSSAQQAASPGAAEPAAAVPGKSQAELEAELSKMLSGATLDGSYTGTGGRNPDQLRKDKYTLGEVKKLEGNLWMIQARIQYRDGDAVMVPLPLPIEWAGDTPVIVVDDFTIPGLGTFSARVMFFDDHYVGYWKHGDRGGHLFGVVRREGTAAPAAEKSAE